MSSRAYVLSSRWHKQHGMLVPARFVRSPRKKSVLFPDWVPLDIRKLYSSTKRNAHTRKIEFLLTHEDFVALWASAAGRCQISGISFSDEDLDPNTGRRPWAASLDRIDSYRPYEPSNVRFVCVAANLAMSVWGAKILYRLSQAVTQVVTHEESAVPKTS